jgi:hypothetical protein
MEGTMLSRDDANFEAFDQVQVGDLVRTGANLYPHYAVIAVYEDMCWVRDVQTGMDGLTPTRICHRIGAQAAVI